MAAAIVNYFYRTKHSQLFSTMNSLQGNSFLFLSPGRNDKGSSIWATQLK